MRARPGRKSFHYRIYVDLVCHMKMRHKRNNVIGWIAEDRNVTRDFVARIYNRYIRPQLASGLQPKDLQ